MRPHSMQDLFIGHDVSYLWLDLLKVLGLPLPLHKPSIPTTESSGDSSQDFSRDAARASSILYQYFFVQTRDDPLVASDEEAASMYADAMLCAANASLLLPRTEEFSSMFKERFRSIKTQLRIYGRIVDDVCARAKEHELLKSSPILPSLERIIRRSYFLMGVNAPSITLRDPNKHIGSSEDDILAWYMEKSYPLFHLYAGEQAFIACTSNDEFIRVLTQIHEPLPSRESFTLGKFWIGQHNRLYNMGSVGKEAVDASLEYIGTTALRLSLSKVENGSPDDVACRSVNSIIETLRMKPYFHEGEMAQLRMLLSQNIYSKAVMAAIFHSEMQRPI